MSSDSYSVVKAVERCVRRTEFTAGSTVLAGRDVFNLRFVLSSWYCLLVDILPLDQLAHRRMLGFLGGTQRMDVFKLARSCRTFASAFLTNAVTEDISVDWCTLREFKRLAEAEDLYLGLATPLEALYHAWDTDHSIGAFRLIYQWFTFISNVNILTLDLSEKNLQEYKLLESQMSTWQYEEKVVEGIAEILTDWLQQFSLEDFSPNHGPGAIASAKGKLGSRIKFGQMKTDLRLDYFIARLPKSELPYTSTPLPPGLIRRNEIVFVPKKMDKNRVISKEPASLAYFQQGMQHALVACIEKTDGLRGRIQLSNQKASQDAAWEGSLYGKFATLDLSNASDSVTNSLVKRVFRNPDVRRGLWCTRSTEAQLPNGERVALAKFAPMGSSVCFPVETLIFAACCELSAQVFFGRKSRTNEYVVYGDDIVIRHELVPTLLSILHSLHFSVNETKSFWGKGPYRFREACGAFFLNGEDVTPLKLSRRLALMEPGERGRQVGPRMSLCSLANEAYMRGFSELRKACLYALKKYYPGLQGIRFLDPSVSDEIAGTLFSDPSSVTNWNLRSKEDLGKRREFWGSRAYEVLFVQSRPDLRLLAKYQCIRDESPDLYRYWRARARDLTRLRDSGCSEYDPILGVVYAPEPEECRPLRTEEVRKWCYLT